MQFISGGYVNRPTEKSSCITSLDVVQNYTWIIEEHMYIYRAVVNWIVISVTKKMRSVLIVSPLML